MGMPASGLRRADHRVVRTRLRAAGSPPARDARRDHRQGGGEHAGGRRRAPRAHVDCTPIRSRFFDIPVDNVYASPVLLGDGVEAEVRRLCGLAGRGRRGARPRDRQAPRRRGPAIIDKRRPRANESEVMNIIGEVEGKSCVLVDDLVDTAGSCATAAKALRTWARSAWWPTSRTPLLSGPAIERIEASVLDELVVTDTIPLQDNARACRKIRQLSVAGLLAETMRRIRDEESVSSLYID